MMPKPMLARHTDSALLLLRLSVGATFIVHGMMKWATFEVPPTSMIDIVIKALAILEPLAGAMLIIGMAVDVAAIGLAVVMLGAIATKFGQGGGFIGKNAWEFECVLLAASVILASLGPGAWSFDAFCSHEDRHWWQFWKRR